MDNSGIKSRYTGAAVFIFIQITILFAGFTILATVLDFPEVLRESAQSRLELYLTHQSIVQPACWLLAIAGFTQVALSVFLYRSSRNHRKILQKTAVLFGVLAGIFQAIGFIGLMALPPWLGLLPAGICLGLWTTFSGAAMLGERLFDRKIGVFGVAVGCVAVLPALELLGIAPALFEVIIGYVFPAWAVWLVVIAVSLLKTGPDDGIGPLYGWRSLTWSVCLYLLMVLPKLLGW